MAKSTPSVLDPDETWYLPSQVYVAVRPDRTSGGPMLELRTVGKQERAVVLTASSLDQFLACYGADQPWIVFPAEQLPGFAATEGPGFAFGVLLDKTVADELRGTAGGMAGAEPTWSDDASEDWDQVYIPSRPFQPGQPRAQLELQPAPGNHLALMIYSSEATLKASCGPDQPWVTIPAGLVSDARRQAGADTVCLDTPLPNHLQHPPAPEGAP